MNNLLLVSIIVGLLMAGGLVAAFISKKNVSDLLKGTNVDNKILAFALKSIREDLVAYINKWKKTSKSYTKKMWSWVISEIFTNKLLATPFDKKDLNKLKIKSIKFIDKNFDNLSAEEMTDYIIKEITDLYNAKF